MKNIILWSVLLVLLTSAAFAQTPAPASTANLPAEDDGEVINVDTAIGQISLAIEDVKLSESIVRVSDNGIAAENLRIAGPSEKRPLDIVVIIAMNRVAKWNLKKMELYAEVDKLRNQTPGLRVQALYQVKETDFESGLKFDRATHFDDLPAAVTSATNLLRASAERKAILVLTNEVEGLKSDVIKQTNQDLGSSSAMVYLMNVNRIDAKGEKKVIAKANVNGGSIVVKKDDYIGGMFRSFVRLALNLYTVTYDLPEQTDGFHRVTVSVIRTRDNFEVHKNIREFTARSKSVLPVATSVTAASDPTGTPNSASISQLASPKNVDAPKAQALKAAFGQMPEEVAVQELVDKNFNEMLKTRPAELSSEQRDFYYAELLRRPELRDAKIFKDNSKLAKSLRETVLPVLRAYGRENYTKLVVYKSKNPYIALYRECVLLVSTAALGFLTPEEVRASIAHELAHELYGDELKAADQSNDINKQRIVEMKCDLMAVLALKAVGGNDDPYAIVSVAQKFDSWYKKNLPGADLDSDRAPTPEKRERAITLFLRSIAAPDAGNFAVK